MTNTCITKRDMTRAADSTNQDHKIPHGNSMHRVQAKGAATSKQRALQRVAGVRHLVEVAVLEGLETRLAEDGVMVAPCGVGAIHVDARVELSQELGRDAEGSGARERLADGNLFLLDQGRILAQNDLCVLSPAILVSNTFLTLWRRRTGKQAAFEERAVFRPAKSRRGKPPDPSPEGTPC